MNARIILVSHSSTSATTTASFASDDPLDARGAQWAADAAGSLPRTARVHCSPAVACRQTTEAMGLPSPIVIPDLVDWDLGRWRGRTFDAVAADDAEAVQAWLVDASATPHGGESLADLLLRVTGWLESVPDDRHAVVITHASVIRAVVLAVLAAPSSAFWRIDVAPLTSTHISGRPGRWTIRSTAVPLRPPARHG